MLPHCTHECDSFYGRQMLISCVYILRMSAPVQRSMRPGLTDLSPAARRYSAFIPLYPLGILAGEMPLIWSGLPYIQQHKLHSLEMPNSLNFAFSYHIFVQVRRSQ